MLQNTKRNPDDLTLFPLPRWAENCASWDCLHRTSNLLSGPCLPWGHWRLACVGHEIFPCDPEEKRPLHGFGFKHPAPPKYWGRGNIDPEQDYPAGFKPGASGLVVADMDAGKIGDLLTHLKAHGIQNAFHVASKDIRSGKRHVWFRRPEAAERGSIGNRQWAVAGCSGEIRGDRGYVILWQLAELFPLLEGGDYGSLPIYREDLFPRPAKSHRTERGVDSKPLQNRTILTGENTREGTERRIRAYIRPLTEAVSSARGGERNNTLNAKCYAAFQRVWAHETDLPTDLPNKVRELFREAAAACGEEPGKAESTIRSAMEAARGDTVRLEERPLRKVNRTLARANGRPRAARSSKLSDRHTEGAITDLWHARNPDRIWDEERGFWYQLDAQTGHWQKNKTLEVCHEIRTVAKELAKDADKTTQKTFRKSATIRGAEWQARCLCPKTRAWDSSPWHVGIPSGAIELHKDGGYTIHKPAPAEWRITKSLAADPDFENTPRLWLQCLADWTGEDGRTGSVPQYIQRVFGYCLSGSVEERKLFLWYGADSATGKTVCVETIRHCMGDYGGTASIGTFLARRHAEHPTELAHLEGLRFVASTEVARGRSWNVGRVKEVTGGSVITARYMRQDYFDFLPQFKLAIASNDPPNLKGRDSGLRARLDILPFEHTVPEETQNKRLAVELHAEAGGIIAFALEGYRQWRELGGLARPKAVTRITDQYHEEQDQVGAWVSARVALHPEAFLPFGAAYQDYGTWVEAEGEKRMSKRAFCRDLRDVQGAAHEGYRHRSKGMFGLGLKSTKDSPTDRNDGV